jgi:hypothetical protein
MIFTKSGLSEVNMDLIMGRTINREANKYVVIHEEASL